MNKAITEGLVLTPPAFADGLNNWSTQDGLNGDDSYASAGTAALVAADQDFGGCLEVLRVGTTQKLRAFHRTEVQPGTYLQVTVRVKAVSGNFPDVAIAATPASGNSSAVMGLATTATAVTLDAYGKVATLTAIVGTGARSGVDLAWDDRVTRLHVGLDLTGPQGGLIRIDDIEVVDATSVFLRDMMDWVDVRDYGAKGDGTTDDTAAFEAADRAADGRGVLVSAGTYLLSDHVTINTQVRFEGTVTMPASKRLSLVRDFDYPTYAEAFGDEELGFRKAIQALFDFTDHDALDMRGRRVELTEPVDVQAAIFDKTTYANQRSIRNGQIQIRGGAAFDTNVQTAECDFDSARPTVLTGAANIANIEVGSLVTGPSGVGREVYVRSKDEAAGEIVLSNALWGAPAQQTYTFKRFRYALDFSGLANLQRFSLENIEFLLADQASGVLMPENGLIFHVKDCFFTGPRDRGITSHGTGCQGMLIDRCQFLSVEGTTDVQDRHTIAFNINKNDTKIRNNRANKFRHFGVLSGSGHIITGNHFFQGDNRSLGERTAGIVLAEAQAKSVVIGNYIDNCYIEWTNEHDGAPDFNAEFSFGGLQVIGNILFSSNVLSSFASIHIKPHGTGHYLNGVTITGNNIKTIKGETLDRAEFVDTTHADLDYSRFTDVNVHSNTFQGVTNQFQNPITVPITENTAQSTWEVDASAYLPFQGQARLVTAVLAEGRVQNASGQTVWDLPYATPKVGTGAQSVRLNWSDEAKGKVYVTLRCDAPT